MRPNLHTGELERYSADVVESGEEQEGFRHDALLPVGEELEADRTGADLANGTLQAEVGATPVLIPRTIVSPFRVAHVYRLCRDGGGENRGV